ncbi:hypothetical protein Tco_1190987 [Tanacetum coccineum]
MKAVVLGMGWQLWWRGNDNDGIRGYSGDVVVVVVDLWWGWRRWMWCCGCGVMAAKVIWWWGDDGLEMEREKVVRVPAVVTAVVALAVGGGGKLARER